MESEKNCCHRTKERSPQEYKKLVNRLSRIEGQIRGIKNMVEEDAVLHRYPGAGGGGRRGPQLLQQGAAGKLYQNLRGR